MDDARAVEVLLFEAEVEPGEIVAPFDQAISHQHVKPRSRSVANRVVDLVLRQLCLLEARRRVPKRGRRVQGAMLCLTLRLTLRSPPAGSGLAAAAPMRACKYRRFTGATGRLPPCAPLKRCPPISSPLGERPFAKLRRAHRAAMGW